MNFRKHCTTSQTGFQMAPMIDIMFLLLIFFMAAIVYAKDETTIGIKVPTADTGVRTTRQRSEIIVNIDEQGDIFVNNIKMLPTRLTQLLGEVAEEHRMQPVIIRADARTDHEYVVRVLDICRKVDISNVAFAALPKSTEE